MILETLWSKMQVFLALVAPVSFAEMFLREQDKASIARFIFGIHTVHFRSFEVVLTKIFVGIFFCGNRVRFGRLVALSFILTSSGYVLVLSKGLMITQGGDGLLSKTWVIFLLAPASLPIDYMNLWVSKKIYGSERLRGSALKQLFADLLISVSASVAILYFVVFLFGSAFDPMHETYLDALLGKYNLVLVDVLWVISIAGFVSVLAYFALRIALLVTGVTLRALTRLTRLNTHLVLVSDTHKIPLTFVASVFALAYVVLI